MNRLQIDGSTRIRSMGYDVDARELELEFYSPKDSIYVYRQVPLAVYVAFQNAESKGKFFDSNIKGVYEFERIA